MGSIFNWNEELTFNVPKALLLGHDKARAGLVRAMMEGGRIANASERVAELCLPHFEHEEKSVFPVLGLLPYLGQDDLQAEMMDVMSLISDFRAKHAAMNNHHQSIRVAIEALLLAAHKEKNRAIAEFAYKLRAHERTEDEMLYPVLVRIGDYLRQKLAS